LLRQRKKESLQRESVIDVAFVDDQEVILDSLVYVVSVSDDSLIRANYQVLLKQVGKKGGK